ncbi:MAG: PAS domain S-box protein [Fimbriimonadaceae bacterium]|nr:PAS domain S-box protein [Chitinophagales bacterium]
MNEPKNTLSREAFNPDNIEKLEVEIFNRAQAIERMKAELEGMEEEMKQHLTNHRLAFHIENTPLGFIEWDTRLHVKSWSKRAEEIFGWTEKEFVELEKTGFGQVYIEDQPRVFKITQQLITGEIERNKIQHRNYRKDGTVIWCEWFNSVLKDGEGRVNTIMSLVQDITAQKETEEKISKTTRMYAFISQVNQNIIHAKDEETLFRTSCRIAFETGGFKMAWIGILNHDLKSISLSAQSGIPEEVIEQFLSVSYASKGPQTHVLSTGTYYVYNDIANELELTNWKLFAAKHGILSAIVLPIKKSGNIIGTFNLYASELNFFDEEETALLTTVTRDISFAMDIFENAKRHTDSEELVIKNEQRFRALIEKSSDMKTLATEDGELTYGSPSITKALGYSLEEFLHTSVFDIIHPDDIPAFLEIKVDILQTPGKSSYFQQRRRHKNGKWVWCEGSITNMLHEPGVHALVANFTDISEKKIAELAQAESKNLIQTIYAASLDALVIIDEEGIITNWDAKSEVLFGWTETEVAGMKLSATIIPERYRKMHEKGMKHYLKTGEGPILGKTIDISALKKNGDELDVSLSITPSKINGRTHFIGFVRDISEKKIIEQQREFDRNNLHALINNTNDLMWSVDKDFKLITSNQAFDKIIGFMSGGPIEKGSNILEAGFPPDQLKRFKISYDRAFAGEAFTIIEYSATPVEFWSEISFYPIRRGEEVIGTACHSRNITERKKAEINLIQSEKRLNESQAIANLGNWYLNFETNIALWSEEACRIYGFPVDENRHSFDTWVSFIHPEDLDYVMAALKESQKTFSDTILNHRIVLKDGTIKHIYSKSKFELDQNGKSVGLYGIAHDVTERKIQEAALEKQMSLEIKNKELEQFAYIASHDLQEPLRTVANYMQVFEEDYPDVLDDNAKKYLHAVNNAISRMSVLIKSLLDFSRLGTNKKLSCVDCNKLIDDVIADLDTVIKTSRAVIKITDMPKLNLYEIEIRQVFQNLITNAIKFRKKDTRPKIEIRSEKVNEKWKFSVSDNGIGIEPIHFERIFDIFQRLHTNKEYEGSGIGLANCKKIIQMHQGDIWVESIPGEGTTFYFTIPNLTE